MLRSQRSRWPESALERVAAWTRAIQRAQVPGRAIATPVRTVENLLNPAVLRLAVQDIRGNKRTRASFDSLDEIPDDKDFAQALADAARVRGRKLGKPEGERLLANIRAQKHFIARQAVATANSRGLALFRPIAIGLAKDIVAAVARLDPATPA